MMSSADRFRENRLSRIHTRLLEASDRWPTLRYTTVGADTVISLLDRPFTGAEDFLSNSSGHPDPLYLRIRKAFLQRNLNLSLLLGNAPLGAQVHEGLDLLEFDARDWYGFYHIAEGYECTADEAIDSLRDLSGPLVDEFLDPLGFRSPDKRWIELVCETFPKARRVLKLPDLECSFAWLPPNVFLASARAIELLVERPDDAAHGGKKATVNARMLEKIQADPECRGWASTKWERFLKCARSTVVATPTWKDLQLTRERLKAELALDRHQKTKGGRG